MNEEELIRLLSELEEGLNRDGLSSLVDQERISAVEGKTEELTEEDIAEFRDEWSLRGVGRRPRVRAEDVRVRPLTSGERLAELLDLLEVAVGGSYAIERRLRGDIKNTLDTRASFNAWSGHIVFSDPPESELAGVTQPEWSLPDESELRQRADAVQEVIRLINQLRQQAQLPRSGQLHKVAAPDEATSDLDITGEWS